MKDKLQVSELLEAIASENSFSKRVNLLKENRTAALELVLILNFSNTKKKAILEEKPPIDFPEDRELNLNDYIQDFAWFWEGIPITSHASKSQREIKYLNVLKNVSPKERDALISGVCRNLERNYKFLTRKLIETAFPTLL